MLTDHVYELMWFRWNDRVDSVHKRSYIKVGGRLMMSASIACSSAFRSPGRCIVEGFVDGVIDASVIQCVVVCVLDRIGVDAIVETIWKGGIEFIDPEAFTFFDGVFAAYFYDFDDHVRWLVDLGEVVEHSRTFSTSNDVGSVKR